MSVTCHACGDSWPRDPALEVACPSCPAGVGQQCRRPSGHRCNVHHDRDRLAMSRGFLKPCPASLKTAQQPLFTSGARP